MAVGKRHLVALAQMSMGEKGGTEPTKRLRVCGAKQKKHREKVGKGREIPLKP